MGGVPLNAKHNSPGLHMTLTPQPISLSTANGFVACNHRHSGQVVGHIFSVGLFDEEYILRGVAIVGRPVARALDDGATVEVTRLATDGTRNACSMLYAAARREAKRRGYGAVVTYTRTDESGASLRASGFRVAGKVTARQWSCPSRPRQWRDAVARTRWGSVA